jgi:phosphohistidine phosphatase
MHQKLPEARNHPAISDKTDAWQRGRLTWQACLVTDDTQRRLILLRHAKSDWTEDLPDHDRPLAKRGRRDAPVIGRWLRDRGYLPDVVVCSTACRTRQTWDLVAAELGDATPEVRFESRAYGASSHALLYLARELPPGCRAALLVGHNPGISELATALAAGVTGSAEGTHPRRISFPTAGVAVLEFAADWPDLAPGHAQLADVVIPADLQRETH